MSYKLQKALLMLGCVVYAIVGMLDVIYKWVPVIFVQIGFVLYLATLFGLSLLYQRVKKEKENKDHAANNKDSSDGDSQDQ